ncbi:hypothetical protein [Mesorhizobium sp. M7A.F.Ca.MR.362.00.0.0]|uniref:hypothetical protein n=1 Tax=Mesorhizobium sp. M7A.F.Ca.MR.362.00.0.0 TaxID=2496779 RepID=UPI000FD3F225|nr:hypothetical protein [Mesorhizobium sp. M7A.F.Ca.MR.362.00.0.0]RUU76129.1 hypothetical protein EOC06_28135 [Mesorhizobium sp. M7A.F.Ca.MR.362.00.0.0]RWN95391.1 MAG: hypothetical protein EOS05_11400 [Mesorhizobium sp.]
MMHIDDVNVRLKVDLSCFITVGIYAGPITPEVIAEHVYDLVVRSKMVDLIDAVTIDAITLDDNTTIIEGSTCTSA